MNPSFTHSTEAITHDSDPKYLTFERLSTDPADQAGEGRVVHVIGQELPLPSLIVGNSPGTTGPTLGDLTLGNLAADKNSISLQFEPPIHNSDLETTGTSTVKFSELTGGQLTFRMFTNVAGGQTFTLTAAQIVALAAAQGKSNMSEAYLDLTDFVWEPGMHNPFQIMRADVTCDTTFTASTAIDASLSLSEGLIAKDDVGPNYDLIPALPAASLTTGGYVNYLGSGYTIDPTSRLTVQLKLTGTSTTSGVLHLQLNLDNSSSLGEFTITTDQLKALATAQGNLGKTTLQVSSVDLGWDLSGLAGRTVTSIDWVVSTGFASSGFAMANPSSIGISYGSAHDTMTVVSVATEHHTNPFGGWGSGTPTFTISGDWRSNSDTFEQLSVDVDAISVKNNALTSQLSLQSTAVIMDGVAIYSFMAAHVGWTITGGLPAQNMIHNYGPSSVHEPSIFRLAIKSGMPETPSYDVISSFDPLNVAGTFTDGLSRTQVLSTTSIEFRVSLYPIDSPLTYGSTVVTSPYEVRQRNLPLFKLNVTGTPPNPESPPTFVIAMFGSQGSPDKDEQLLREWTPLSFETLKATGITAPASIASITVANHYPGLPDNFSGIAVFPSKECIGPWNYIRFMLLPAEGKLGSDYTGLYLTITANARELF
jgi:hypothetical protein